MIRVKSDHLEEYNEEGKGKGQGKRAPRPSAETSASNSPSQHPRRHPPSCGIAPLIKRLFGGAQFRLWKPSFRLLFKHYSVLESKRSHAWARLELKRNAIKLGQDPDAIHQALTAREVIDHGLDSVSSPTSTFNPQTIAESHQPNADLSALSDATPHVVTPSPGSLAQRVELWDFWWICCPPPPWCARASWRQKPFCPGRWNGT